MAKMKEVQCSMCGKSLIITRAMWRKNRSIGRPFRCKECLHAFMSQHAKDRIASMSDEDKKARNVKISNTWKNKSKEEKSIIQRKFHNTIATKSDEEKQAINIKRKATVDSKSDEEKQASIDKFRNSMADKSQDEKWASRLRRQQTWANKTLEERNVHSEQISETWRNKTNDEKKAIGHKISESWKNKSEEEKQARSRHGSESLLNRPLSAKIKTANKIAVTVRDKNQGKLESWFCSAFESQYGEEYRLIRENPASNQIVHKWDYTVMSGADIKMVIDMDEYSVHGDKHKEYGRSSLHGRQRLRSSGPGSEQRDAERGLTIPDGIPFMVISEEYKEDSFRDLTSMLGKPYEDYVQWMYKCLRTQPFPYPKYTHSEILSSYNRLRYRLKDGRNTPGIMALDGTHWDCLYGQHIMYHFYHSIWHDAVPGKTCPHDAFMNDDILMDMIRKRYILHVRNRNKITQCFLLSEEAPRVPIFTPIMGMKVIHKYCNEYSTIVDCNTQYGGVLLASLAMGKKYIGYDKDIAHHNESVKLINWFPTVGITVYAKMIDRAPSGDCMCSYVPFGDEYIDELLQRTNCTKYVLAVPNTDKYTDNVVESFTTDDHWGERRLYIIILNKDPHG